MNLPNAITLARLLAVPFIGWLVVQERYGAALVAFAAAAVSDAVDGMLARLLDQRTALGATLDPAADKLLVVTALATLAWVGRVPPWFLAVVFVRDLVLSGAYWTAYGLGRRLPVRPSLLGKATTVLQLALVVAALWSAPSVTHPGPAVPGWTYVAVAAVTVASGLDYFRRGLAQLRGSKA
ncbi:MAG TPA: CDP-alcohol phosphatidyltransferase family protein [Thermodesulfobacteriota bacterium]